MRNHFRVRAQNRPVSRISMSLTEELLGELDAMVAQRGFGSRSQALSDMLHQFLTEHKRQRGDEPVRERNRRRRRGGGIEQ